MMKKNAQRGFTLMELMVVIVIVAILAAVAVPLYLNYVNDARRTEARGAIGAIITAEQTFRQQNPSYTAADFTTDGLDPALNCDLQEAAHNWNIVVSAADPSGYTVTATGIGTMVDAGVVTMTYTRAGGAVFNP
jgi:prepilin-type N-terminal cleavage/methylation domain-containing protein